MSAATGNRSFAITGKRSDGTAISLSKVQSFVKTVDGDDGDDGDPGANAPVVHTSASHVNFNKDGSTYDPAGTSTILLEAGPNTTITSASFAASPSSYITISNSSTSGCTATFSANRTAAQINGNNKVTADLTGTITKADGTTVTGVDFGEYVIPIPTSINGADGDPGANGFRTVQGYIFYEKTTSGAPSAPAGNTYTFSQGLLVAQDLDQQEQQTFGQTNRTPKILQVVILIGL